MATGFVQEDLATPQINISYGTYYLRYLLDRYDQNETPAVAAYNAGPRERGPLGEPSRGSRRASTSSDIRFPETRAYVNNVLERRGEYRDHYGDELGL